MYLNHINVNERCHWPDRRSLDILYLRRVYDESNLLTIRDRPRGYVHYESARFIPPVMHNHHCAPDTYQPTHDVQYQCHFSGYGVCAAFAHKKSLRPCSPGRRRCLAIRLRGRHTAPDTKERRKDGKDIQDFHHAHSWYVGT